MRLILLISLSLLLAVRLADAQTAADFFDSGAQLYISNNIPDALESVTNGLKQYPDNVKLQKLYKLLKQQQKQQQQQQNQKNQNQKNQSQQQKSQNQQSQSQSSQQKKQQGQKSKQEQAKESKNKSGENETNQQANAAEAHAMTPQEAKRLLDSQKGNEQLLQLKPKVPPQNPNQPVKDW